MRFYLFSDRRILGMRAGAGFSPSDLQTSPPVTAALGRVIGRLLLTTVVGMLAAVGVGVLTHNDLAVIATSASAAFLLMHFPWDQARIILRWLVILLFGLFAFVITWMILAAGH
jgi:hypothetical protein